ncbi:MAG: biopolymer transporter ExbD [Aequorivita sp.]|nr:biopolymer transporter ExbD [Aequorivita sp.]
MRNSTTPSVNAGSMADIAFLLLIFFLVTSMIPNDKGIAQNLPQACPPGADCNIPIKKNNLFTINVNQKGEIMANSEITNIKDLKEKLKDFIDNNADKSCLYCKGAQLEAASDNPTKASISLSIHREAPYQSFITVQDEIAKAYFELRETYVAEVLKKDVSKITEKELKKVQEAYPFRIIEPSQR